MYNKVVRVAILHDYLNQFGGAERVLKALLEIFPRADIYTLLYDKKRTRGMFRKHKIYTSFLDKPFIRKRHRFFIPLMPFAARMFRKRGTYDLAISSSAGYAKGFSIRTQFHVCYCHSPLRYAWEIEYLKDIPFSPRSFSRAIADPIARRLRKWDKKVSESVNVYIANSRHIGEKIRSYYGRDAAVVYPPVDRSVFYPDAAPEKGDYYLMVGRLLYYKRFDLGILAFNRLRRHLKIIGRGPEEKQARKIADPKYIEFIPYVKDSELRRLYSTARALIFPQVEDFGLVAAEAQACGLPVIAYGRGGAKEIVTHRETGLLFHEQTPEAIMNTVRDFELMRFDRKKIADSAKRFSKENFKKNFLSSLAEAGVRV